MPWRLSGPYVCAAFMCTVVDVMLYATVLPNGTQLQVALCDFHALELEEIPLERKESKQHAL